MYRPLNIIRDFQDGEIHAEEAAFRIAEVETKIKDELAMIKSFKDDLIDPLQVFKENYPEGYKGMTVEIRAGRTNFNFKGIEEVREAEETAKFIKEKYKNAFYQLERGVAPVDAETGEVMDLPKVTHSAPVLILKIKG